MILRARFPLSASRIWSRHSQSEYIQSKYLVPRGYITNVSLSRSTAVTEAAVIHREIKALRMQLDRLEALLGDAGSSQEKKAAGGDDGKKDASKDKK